ncbi:MAG TPA: metalloregulator ArsR/SmtB family transcription factor [Steroidobacteraceae bacterium]|nr:metalloregulator ArsR/SmtB family transcription factor [Steroidobacteraceae bacterium]
MATRAARATARESKSAKAARDIKPYAQQAATLLKALANDQRLMILCNLIEGPLSVGELNKRLDLSQSALSQHLAVLREANIVTTERDSQSVLYSLPKGPATSIIGILYKEFCELT